MTRYQREKARAKEKAMQFQDSFAEGESWSWLELAEAQAYFEKQAKRYGLTDEFKENGII